MLENLQENALIYVTAALVISEGLSLLPFLKANSIIQAAIGFLGKVKKFLSKKE
jgi:hypothetical protein